MAKNFCGQYFNSLPNIQKIMHHYWTTLFQILCDMLTYTKFIQGWETVAVLKCLRHILANSISFKGQTNLNCAAPAIETEKAKTNRKISLTFYCKEVKVRGLLGKTSFKLYTVNSNFLQFISNLWATWAHACSHPHINTCVRCTHNTKVMIYNLVLFIHVVLLMHDQ